MSLKPKRRVSFSDTIDDPITIDDVKPVEDPITIDDPITIGDAKPIDDAKSIIDDAKQDGAVMNAESFYRDNSNDRYDLKKEYDNDVNSINDITTSNNIKFNFSNMDKEGIYQIEWIDTNQSLGIMLEEESDEGMTLILIKGIAPGKKTSDTSIIEKSIQINDVLIMINDISMVFHGFSFVQQTIHNCKLAQEKIVLTFLRTSILSLESFLKKELELEVDPKYNIPIELFVEEPDKAVIPNKLISPLVTVTNNSNNNDNDIIDIKDYIVKNIDRLSGSQITELKKLLEEIENKSQTAITTTTTNTATPIDETYDEQQQSVNTSSKILDMAQQKMTDFNAKYNYDNDLLENTNVPWSNDDNLNTSDKRKISEKSTLPLISDSKKSSNMSVVSAVVSSKEELVKIEPQTDIDDYSLSLPIIRTPSIKVREPDLDSDLISVSSSQSVIPFPFGGHPSLPHVDKYIKDEKLTMEYMKKQVSQEKDQKLKRVKAKKRSKKVDGTNYLNDDCLFSESDIYTLMVYFQSFCDNTNSNNTNQEISLPDMEAAFRKYKQATITLEEEMYARELMVSFEWLLQECNLTPSEWFLVADVKGAIGGDGKLTYAELVEGINKLCDLIEVPKWREADIFKLLKYMDPSGDGDLTAAEVKLAFKRFYMPPESKTMIDRAGPIIEKLEWYLHSQRLRVRDLFSKIDIDGSMSISITELSDAMRKIIGKKPKNVKEKRSYNHNDGKNVNEVNSMYDYSDDDMSVSSDYSVSDMSVSSLGESVYSNYSLNHRGYKNNVYDGIPTRSFAHNRKFLNMPSLRPTPVKKSISQNKLRAGDLLPENNLDIVIDARKIVEVRDDTPNYLKPELSQSENVLAAFNLATSVYSPISFKLKPTIKTSKVNKYCRNFLKKYEVQDKFANHVQRSLKQITYNINIV